jgi:flavin reductase (DIM6/NTAB) family NADH-FMN oxidoreductase RutF
MQQTEIQNPQNVVAVGTGASFRNAMRQLPGGVSVITVGHEDDRSGMTVTSVSSLSVEPPTLIVCANKQSSTWALMRRYGAFGVNVLASNQQHIADRFSGHDGVKGPARYNGEDWITLVTGTPLLANALAIIDCNIENTIERHSHAIVIGWVQAVRIHNAGPGLVYWQGRYGPSADELQADIRGLRAAE